MKIKIYEAGVASNTFDVHTESNGQKGPLCLRLN
jgi:hypothetical protein